MVRVVLFDFDTFYATNLFFPVLRIIRLSQQQHGLRHGDYQRYRYVAVGLREIFFFNVKNNYIHI